MQLLPRRSRAGSQISILRSAKSGMRVKWGHSGWEKASMFLVHGVEVLGQCSDGDMVAWSEVTAQLQDPLLPSSLLFLISWTRGNFRLVCPAWQRQLGQRLGIAASCDTDTGVSGQAGFLSGNRSGLFHKGLFSSHKAHT